MRLLLRLKYCFFCECFAVYLLFKESKSPNVVNAEVIIEEKINFKH